MHKHADTHTNKHTCIHAERKRKIRRDGKRERGKYIVHTYY
jgi:hypothetical protein